MIYGKIENGCCAIYPQYRDGLKPVIESSPEPRDGYYATFVFHDNGNEIVKVWNYHEIEPPEKDVDATTDDYETALRDLGVSL